jgi:hypothetical protein
VRRTTDGPPTVTGNGVWFRRMGPLDCCGIARHHLVQGGEEGVAGLEAMSTEREACSGSTW